MTGHVEIPAAARAYRAQRMTAPTVETPPGDAPPAGDTPDPSAFRIPVMVLEGVETSDHRFIEPGVLTWRLPQPLMGLDFTPEWGHDGAILAGRIESVTRADVAGQTNPVTGDVYPAGTQALVAEGHFDLADPDATDIARRVRERFLNGVSVDVAAVLAEVRLIDAVTGEELDPEDEANWWRDDVYIREHWQAGEVIGATVCPMPAFSGAWIEMLDAPIDWTDPSAVPAHAGDAIAASLPPALRIVNAGTPGCAPCDAGLVASAATAVDAPPAAWFADPELPEITPLTVTDDGRVFGHLAPWDECHIGNPDACVVAPRSATNYAYFRTGAVRTSDGTDIAVGQITLGTGHASTAPGVTARAAVEHYDNTGTAVADVIAGEDAHGIWVAGAVRPGLEPARLRELRGAALSGDWRWIGRSMELVAALACNVQGFPIPRLRATVASGVPVALVAAGVPQLLAAAARRRRESPEGIESAIGRALSPLLGLAARAERERYRSGRASRRS